MIHQLLGEHHGDGTLVGDGRVVERAGEGARLDGRDGGRLNGLDLLGAGLDLAGARLNGRLNSRSNGSNWNQGGQGPYIGRMGVLVGVKPIGTIVRSQV